MDLFNQVSAHFSPDRKYRFALWRKWDERKPLIAFFGLNPSTANEFGTDPTIRSVMRITRHNGCGGFVMLNCFPFVSTDPDMLRDFGNTKENDRVIKRLTAQCEHVVFAWGNFKVVRDLGRDHELMKLFPKALCLGINKNGSPKHPLFIKGSTKLIPYVKLPVTGGGGAKGNRKQKSTIDH